MTIGRAVMLGLGVGGLTFAIVDLAIWRQYDVASWVLVILVSLFILTLGLTRLRWQKPAVYESGVLPDTRPWSDVLSRRRYFVHKREIIGIRVLRADEVRGTYGYPRDQPALVQLVLRDGSKVYLDAVDCGKEMMDHFLAYEKHWEEVSLMKTFPSMEELKARFKK